MLDGRLRQTAIIKEKGPDLMRRLVTEVGAIVEEYRRKAGVGNDDVAFQALPREAFCVTRAASPKVSLECHPDYEAHVVYCNMTRTDAHESETRESMFSLDLTVGDSDTITWRYQARAFRTLDDVVEFLLKPVLFPPVVSEFLTAVDLADRQRLAARADS